MKRFLTAALAALGLVRIAAVQAAPVQTKLQPIFVRVPNGFNMPFKSNGASRRRKTNRLHLSTKTRNKHR